MLQHKLVTKTVGLSDEAYRRFLAMKQPGESFSDVILRITSARALLEMAGTMDEETARHYDRVLARRDREEARQSEARFRRLWRK